MQPPVLAGLPVAISQFKPMTLFGSTTKLIHVWCGLRNKLCWSQYCLGTLIF